MFSYTHPWSLIYDFLTTTEIYYEGGSLGVPVVKTVGYEVTMYLESCSGSI